MVRSTSTGFWMSSASATSAGGMKTTSIMILRVCAKITGSAGTPWRSARLALSTGPIGTEARAAVIMSTRVMRMSSAATAKPAKMVRTAVAIIGTNSDDRAATAAGVNDSPTEVATIIWPIGRVIMGTRTGISQSRRAVAKAMAPIIQGRGNSSRSPTTPHANAPT